MLKPYYQNEMVTIYHGDCRDNFFSIPYDAIVTDPPYGINYQHSGQGNDHITAPRNLDPIHGDDAPFDPAHIIDAITSHGGSGAVTPVVLWGANYFANKLPPGQWLVWDKSCGGGSASSFSDAEFAWASRRTARNIYRHLWMGVCRTGTGDETKKRVHPSQKPVGLMSWCIEQMRIGIGKIVFDPYMGSGSTALACLRTGRRFIGFEIDGDICETAARRIEAFTKQREFDFANT